MKELGEKYNVLQAAFASCERVFQLLSEPRFPPANPAARKSERRGAAKVEFDAVVRIDTPGEADYYRNGGILQYVLRNMLKSD